jgi:hypothetical protein
MRSLEDLLPLLKSRTESGAIRWDANGSGFAAEFAGHEFFIWQWTDPSDDTIGFTLNLKNDKELIIDSIVSGEFDPNKERLAQLYGVARRSAYSVDEVIDDLERALKAS